MYYQVERTNVRILGSMHLVPAEHPDLPGWVWSAYEWSELLAFEHDIALVPWVMNLPDGQTLDNRLPPFLLERLKAAWPANSPQGRLRNQKLWVVAIGLPLQQVKLVAGVEFQLTKRAKAEKKPVFYLETVAEFAALADGIDDGRYTRLIELTLNSLSQCEQLFRDMYAAWLSQRIHAIEQVLPRTVLAADPIVRSAAIDQRNQAWIPKIVEGLQSPKRILIAVGALHLAGPTGLLALLEKRGYQVSPVVG